MIKAGIVGGAGYTGGELISILLHHSEVTLSFVHSQSQAGKYIHDIHHDLLGETELRFTSELLNDIDVLFLCVGHGEAKHFLEKNTIPEEIKIIDLSQDFRLASNQQVGSRTFTYGLPELNRTAIKEAKNIANPGCFATAVQLSLLPLAKAGLLKEVHTTGITGSTGAGQSLQPTSHFSWRTNNIQAYKTLNHQHLHEIQQSLQQLQKEAVPVHFIPWRGDFTRGIFASSQIPFTGDVEMAYQLFENYYKTHPFTYISRTAISLKQVVNTNKCILQLELEEGQLVVHAVIDNLLKGASGQAVQNMNLLFGLEETTGLQLKGSRF
jgi:N-acetyl-gamma-glutamyl-phosphate reductase